MKLWLDDERDPPDDSWVRVKTAQDCINELKTGNYDLVSLDHDLGEKKATGYDVLVWMENTLMMRRWWVCPNIAVHTANPPARERMNAAIGAMESYLGKTLSPGR